MLGTSLLRSLFFCCPACGPRPSPRLLSASAAEQVKPQSRPIPGQFVCAYLLFSAVFSDFLPCSSLHRDVWMGMAMVAEYQQYGSCRHLGHNLSSDVLKHRSISSRGCSVSLLTAFPLNNNSRGRMHSLFRSNRDISSPPLSREGRSRKADKVGPSAPPLMVPTF